MDPKSDATPGPDGVASTRAPSPVVTVGDTLEVVPAAAVAAESQGWAGFDDDSPLPPRKPRVFTPVTWALAAGLLAVGGFALGAKVGRSSAPKAATGAAAAAAAFGGQRAGAGANTTVAGRAATGTGTTVAGGNGPSWTDTINLNDSTSALGTYGVDWTLFDHVGLDQLNRHGASHHHPVTGYRWPHRS